MLLVTTTLFFFFMKKILLLEILVKRKMLNVSPATNILRSSPEERHKSLTSHHLKWSFLLLIAVMSTLFCLLLKGEVKYSQMETEQLTLEAWWMNTSCRRSTPFWEWRRTQRNCKELKRSNEYSCLRHIKENLREPIRTKSLWSPFQFLLVLFSFLSVSQTRLFR